MKFGVVIGHAILMNPASVYFMGFCFKKWFAFLVVLFKEREKKKLFKQPANQPNKKTPEGILYGV